MRPRRICSLKPPGVSCSSACASRSVTARPSTPRPLEERGHVVERRGARETLAGRPVDERRLQLEVRRHHRRRAVEHEDVGLLLEHHEVAAALEQVGHRSDLGVDHERAGAQGDHRQRDELADARRRCDARREHRRRPAGDEAGDDVVLAERQGVDDLGQLRRQDGEQDDVARVEDRLVVGRDAYGGVPVGEVGGPVLRPRRQHDLHRVGPRPGHDRLDDGRRDGADPHHADAYPSAHPTRLLVRVRIVGGCASTSVGP